ncbi:right-handed parallel beta-helix repeat-containing protein [Arthrobacter antioxidans]|uniref:right-handed parallel beta-helix repeat-containing protein n=1 Tax=Arthrobacter antioxidans TaxID=2895818 RepID=UPI001FFF836B|nr:right-handed parallel beta-helix repeat-containing protein [Arthrobacter antioxidans]
MNRRPSSLRRHRLPCALLALGVALPALAAPAHALDETGAAGQPDPRPSAEASIGDLGTTEVMDGTDYPGNPELEAALVADEDRRLTEVRTVASMVRWRNLDVKTAYRLAAGSAYSLVLTSRDEAYTVESLLELAPQTFVRQPDGSFLLSEHLVIQNGATLDLSEPGGLELRMASDAQGFVSIVNYGGTLKLSGSEGNPVRIRSWDRDKGTDDTLTDDGRAYIRSIGGQVALNYVELHNMGFWSGRTGGLSLTGTDRPSTGTLATFGRDVKAGVEALKDAPGTESPQQPVDGVLPAGELPLPDVDLTDPTYSYVSASITDTTIDGNAFGLFIANANGVDIKDTTVRNSLADGVVMHRYVTNAAVGKTEASDNAGDGFVLSRATTGIVLSEVTARDNRRNGISIEGQPLANGPSATGIALGRYGNNSVANSTAEGNGRYGIEVVGGDNVGVHANNISGNTMGIVVRDGARNVSVVGNQLRDQVSQGIAVRDTVSDATVSGNIVDGGEIGIYVRDSIAEVGRNTLTGLTNHGITIVGATQGTAIAQNTIAGQGPSAVDSRRAAEVTIEGNTTSAWNDTTPWYIMLRNFFQPLTVLWLLLALIVVVTAVKGAGRSRDRQHPYADKIPLTAITGSATSGRRTAGPAL